MKRIQDKKLLEISRTCVKICTRQMFGYPGWDSGLNNSRFGRDIAFPKELIMMKELIMIALWVCSLVTNFLLLFLPVLKSEVEDLRILIQSADRDVESLKRARNNDAIEAGRRYASLESKVLTVSVFFDLFPVCLLAPLKILCIRVSTCIELR